MVEGAGSPDRIRVAGGVQLLAERNLFRDGGITGAAPMSYVGINNYQKTTKSGFTPGLMGEIADSIRNSDRYRITKEGKSFNQAGSVTALTATPIVLFAPGSGQYNISASTNGGDNTYSAVATVISDGGNVALLNNASGSANFVLSVSGGNIRLTQSSGSTQTVFWVATKIQ